MHSDSTVFVVDDDPQICSSISWLIESTRLPVETFATAQDFLAAFTPDRVGCLITDVRLPGMSGLDLLEHMSSHDIQLPTILITAYGDVSMAVRGLKSGAMDFIEKPYNDQTLLDAIHRAIEIDASNRKKRAQRAEVQTRLARLTAREREVMDLVVVGRANKQVAAELGCSGKTVEVHRARVMEKMRATSLANLVHMALIAGDHAALPNAAFPTGRIPL